MMGHVLLDRRLSSTDVVEPGAPGVDARPRADCGEALRFPDMPGREGEPAGKTPGGALPRGAGARPGEGAPAGGCGGGALETDGLRTASQ
jgi:hypothetical protein